MEQELGGEAAALLRQKRAALRRRGCSFESPRYRGQEGCGWEGQKRGAGHVWGVEVGGNRGLGGRGAGCGRWGGGLRVSGEEPGPSGGGSRGLEHTSGRCEGGHPREEPGERRESRPDETPAKRWSYGRPGAELWHSAESGLWRMPCPPLVNCSRTRSGNSPAEVQGRFPSSGEPLCVAPGPGPAPASPSSLRR